MHTTHSTHTYTLTRTHTHTHTHTHTRGEMSPTGLTYKSVFTTPDNVRSTCALCKLATGTSRLAMPPGLLYIVRCAVSKKRNWNWGVDFQYSPLHSVVWQINIFCPVVTLATTWSTSLVEDESSWCLHSHTDFSHNTDSRHLHLHAQKNSRKVCVFVNY